MENITNIIIKIFFIFLLPPLIQGIINKVKAFFSGKKGRPLFQVYYDIIKLMKKGSVYSNSISFIFHVAPVLSFVTLLFASILLPFAGEKSIISFNGDLILIMYLIALNRFFLVLSALDTGSSFEAMGASREMFFSFFSEIIFFMSILTISFITKSFSISIMLSSDYLFYATKLSLTSLILCVFSIFIVLLSENSRVPFDDPNTHLELTMIHEVMILDNSGIDLGFILYSASIKLYFFAAIVASIIFPLKIDDRFINYSFFIFKILLVSVLVGIVESIIVRIRLVKIPNLMLIVFLMTIISFVFEVIKII